MNQQQYQIIHHSKININYYSFFLQFLIQRIMSNSEEYTIVIAIGKLFNLFDLFYNNQNRLNVIFIGIRSIFILPYLVQ